MFDLSFSNILHSNLFNFILLVVILYIVAAPFIKKSIQSANTKVSQTINDSVQRKEKALNNLEKTKEDYAKTPDETAEIGQIAKKTIDSLKIKSETDIETIKNFIKDNANKSILTETSKIKSKITKEVTEQSVDKALEKIKDKLSQDENLHDILIERAIEKLEKI
ncbi:hypothetical protein IJG14_05020 [bacterium]|nr:hypothetical protein [bacterium]